MLRVFPTYHPYLPKLTARWVWPFGRRFQLQPSAFSICFVFRGSGLHAAVAPSGAATEEAFRQSAVLSVVLTKAEASFAKEEAFRLQPFAFSLSPSALRLQPSALRLQPSALRLQPLAFSL